MTQRRKIAALLACGLVVIGFIFYVFGPRNIVYPWQPTSVWLRDLKESQDEELRWRASELLQKAGTNAMPAVLAELGYRDSALKAKTLRLVQKLPLIKISFATAEAHHDRGIRACQVLGRDAKSAIPLVSSFLSSHDRRNDAVLTLAAIGPESVAVLCQLLTNDDSYLRSSAAGALGWMESDAHQAVPDLLKSVNDPDDSVRCNAISALGLIRSRDPTVIPALITGLNDTDTFNRVQAADALARYSSEAKEAVPALLKAVHTDDKVMKVSVIRALNLIDREAAERAGLKADSADLVRMRQDAVGENNVIDVKPKSLREWVLPQKPAPK